MQEDLIRNFKVSVKIETRTMNCLLLAANSNIKFSVTKSKPPESDIGRNNIRKYLQNRPVSDLSRMLESIFQIHVIDDTNLSQHIDVEFPKDIYEYDADKWKVFLNQIGFDLKPAQRLIQVAVFRDDVQQ